jgi:hypothetical protein
MGLAILLICVVLAGVYGYFGFLRPDPEWPSVNTRNRAAAVFLLVIALVAFWSVVADLTAPGRLAEYLPPYPGARASHVPSTGDDSLWWLLYAEDPPEAVVEFYRKEENRPGWAIRTEESALIILARQDLQMTVFAARRGGETTISYRLGPRHP